jgi:hypothetical protein
MQGLIGAWKSIAQARRVGDLHGEGSVWKSFAQAGKSHEWNRTAKAEYGDESKGLGDETMGIAPKRRSNVRHADDPK